MKEIFIIFTLFFVAAYCGQIVETTTGCYVRETSEWRTAERLGVAVAGWEFEVTDTFGDWYLVNLPAGTTVCLDRAEKPGRIKLKEPLQVYVWSQCLDIKNGVIINSGVNIRTAPKKDSSTYKGSILPGTKVEIIKCIITQYKVKPVLPHDLKWQNGWISSVYVKRLRYAKNE